MNTAIVGIDLFPQPHDTLGDKVRRAGQARALVTFAKKVEDAAKADLSAEVEAESARTGTGFSAKVDGIRASLSDPQAKPRVDDREAFEEWWIGKGYEYAYNDRVEVHSPRAAALALGVIGNPVFEDDDATLAAAARDLAACLTVVTEYVLPANALDSLTENGTCTATDDGLVEIATGELVPGVVCARARPVLSIVPDKAAKARDAQIVASFFGVDPAALEGGAA